MLILEGLRGKNLETDERLAFEVLKDVAVAENIFYYFLGNLASRTKTEASYSLLLNLYKELLSGKTIDEIKASVGKIDLKSKFFIDDVADVDKIAKELLHRDITMLLPKIDDYVDADPIPDIASIEKKLVTDSAGLVSVNTDFDLHLHGMIYQGKLLYYHQFLRRFFSARFVDTPLILAHAFKKGLKLRIRIDPLRISEPQKLENIIEADHWYGEKFNVSKMNDPNFVGRTVHVRGVEARRMLHSTYPIDKTIFYVKNYDDGTKEIQIEEILPVNPRVGGGGKYVLHRFAHLIWDSNVQAFNHLDCSVLAYKKDDHELRVLYDWKPPENIDIKGKRIKLFRLDGALDFELTLDILYSYFRYNEMIQEYFTSVNFKDSQMYSESHFAEMSDEKLAELDAILDEYETRVA